jgi:hypothetical protein
MSQTTTSTSGRTTTKKVRKDALSVEQIQAVVKKSLRLNILAKDTEKRIVMLFSEYAACSRLTA